MAVGISACVGLLAAYSIASEPIAYIASMFYGIYLYMMIPVVLAFVICATIFAARYKQPKIAWGLFLSAIMLPASYIGGIQVMKAGGWVLSQTNGSNEMRPLGLKPNGSVVIVYNEGVSHDEKEKLSNEVIFPWKSGPGFTHETGVCEGGGLKDIGKRTVYEVIFCASATDEKKDKLRMGLDSSPVVYRYFENVAENDVRKKLEPDQLSR